jgi:hypothetical protein
MAGDARIVRDERDYMKILEWHRMSRMHRISRDISGCLGMSQDISGCLGMLKDSEGFRRMQKDSEGCRRIAMEEHRTNKGCTKECFSVFFRVVRVVRVTALPQKARTTTSTENPRPWRLFLKPWPVERRLAFRFPMPRSSSMHFYDSNFGMRIKSEEAASPSRPSRHR